VRRLLFKLIAGVGKRLICQRLGGCAIAVLAASVSLSAAQDRHTAPISSAIDVRAEHLLMRPVAAEWPSFNGDYSGRRSSALAEITTANVAQLRARWVFHAPNSSGLEVTPVAVGGIMLVTAANDAFALDAQTGRAIKALWHFNTGQTISASPMSNAVNSKQYVAIAAGSDVFSFALP
jgi:glucose dehydrogenase